jgi:hypothetical protein
VVQWAAATSDGPGLLGAGTGVLARPDGWVYSGSPSEDLPFSLMLNYSLPVVPTSVLLFGDFDEGSQFSVEALESDPVTSTLVHCLPLPASTSGPRFASAISHKTRGWHLLSVGRVRCQKLATCVWPATD